MSSFLRIRPVGVPCYTLLPSRHAVLFQPTPPQGARRGVAACSPGPDLSSVPPVCHQLRGRCASLSTSPVCRLVASPSLPVGASHALASGPPRSHPGQSPPPSSSGGRGRHLHRG